MQRFNGSSSLFNQPAFLADVLNWRCRPVTSSPCPSTLCGELAAEAVETALELTLAYGLQVPVDPFDIERFPDDGSKTHLIHPVVRIFRRGVVDAEHHVVEALDNEWSDSRHRDPLRRFLKNELTLTA